MTVIDLESSSLAVATQMSLPPYPLMAVTHRDGKRVLVVGGWHILTVVGEDKVVTHKSMKIPLFV